MGSEAPVHSIGKREILCIKYDNRYTQQRNFPTALFLLMYLPGRTNVALFLYQYSANGGHKHSPVIISYAQLSAIFGIYSDLCMRTTLTPSKGTQTAVLLSITYSPKSEIDKALRVD